MPCVDCGEWDRLVIAPGAVCECRCHARDRTKERRRKKGKVNK